MAISRNDDLRVLINIMNYVCVIHVIICSLIEARSCERFHALIPHLPTSLSRFYSRLYKAEARHCDLYLDIYTEIFQEDWSDRLNKLSFIESNFINQKDKIFRFHSGY